MKKYIIASMALALMMSSASALTLKKGQVIGGDGGVYDGASPEVQENLINNAKRSGKKVGLSGGNVFVIVDDTVTYVPTQDLSGLSRDGMVEVVGDAVVENVTGVEGLSLADIEEISSETGISVENISIVEEIAGGLSDELAEDMIAGIQEAIDSGLADQVNEFISSLSSAEIDLLKQYSSLEDCLAAGASGCEEMDAKMDKHGI